MDVFPQEETGFPVRLRAAETGTAVSAVGNCSRSDLCHEPRLPWPCVAPGQLLLLVYNFLALITRPCMGLRLAMTPSTFTSYQTFQAFFQAAFDDVPKIQL